MNSSMRNINASVLCLNPMLDPAGEALLRDAGIAVTVLHDVEGIASDLPVADAVIVRLPARFGAAEIALARRARVVATSGVGVDHIDVDAATRAGIAVVNNPGAGATAVAEHAIALMLAVTKRITQADTLLRTEGWGVRERFHGALMSGDLDGARLGLVGFGAIAAELARIAKHGFRMDVLAFAGPGRHEACAAAGVTRIDDLIELCGSVDFVSVHVPHTNATRHLIGRAAIGAMRPGAVLINTARGPIVDAEALDQALQEGRLAGAGLDVFEQEPLPPGCALLARETVVATPHVAGISRGACRKLALSAAGQVLQVLRGERPPHLVNPEVHLRRLDWGRAQTDETWDRAQDDPLRPGRR